MLFEDQRRLQRERDIAEAVRGPDYRWLEESIRKAKAEARRRHAAEMESWTQERFGHQKAVERGERSGPFKRERPGISI